MCNPTANTILNILKILQKCSEIEQALTERDKLDRDETD